MKKIILLSILGALFLFVFMYAGAYIIGPGSYARAEYYILDIPEAEFPHRVKELKEKYPEYKFFRTDKDEPYEYSDKNNNYYFMLNNKRLFCCILKPNQNKAKTCLGFHTVYGENESYLSKTINNSKEISRQENKKIKHEFETVILDKLGTWKYEKTAVERFLGL